MRGQMDWQGHVFFSLNVEEMLPKDAPIRDIKRRADRILASMDDLFRAAYKPNGRSSIPPEQMLKAMLLRALHSIPGEIKLMEAIRWEMLLHWGCTAGSSTCPSMRRSGHPRPSP